MLHLYFLYCAFVKKHHLALFDFCSITGTRSLGPLGRVFRGSVSDYVVHHVRCPVTICPI